MRVKMLMVGVTAAWLTLASSAEAGDFSCDIPWHSGAVQCGNLFSVRPGETVTIELLSLKDDDGSNVPNPVYIEIVDSNTKKSVTKSLELWPKCIVWYKNETNAEVIGRVDASFKHPKTVHLKIQSA